MSTPIGGLNPQRLANLQMEVRLRFPSAQLPGAAGGASFGEVLQRVLNEASAQQEQAAKQAGAAEAASGAAVAETGVSLETLVEVRNRLTEAYRSVINMQS